MGIKIYRSLSKLFNWGGSVTPSKVARTITAETDPNTFTLTSSNGSWFSGTYQLIARNESTGTSALFFPTSNEPYESANGVSIPLSNRE